jgi:transglutaminase-like putative cysteine protease
LVAPGPRLAPIAAVAALLAAGWLSRRVAAAALIAWIPAAILAAGIPATALAPGSWPALTGHIAAGVAKLATPGAAATGSRWSLVAVALGSGALWIGGGGLAVSAPASIRARVAAFCLLATPWIAAVSIGSPDRAGWQGAVVLLAGILWFSSSRAALSIGLVTALLSLTVAHAVGPRTRLFDLARSTSAEPSFRTLDTWPTYGPLGDRRTGAPMLEITAPEPALWRVQTLDYFDGSGWGVSPTSLPLLPQPAARTQAVGVRVIGLQGDRAVAPGLIRRVDARGKAKAIDGEAWRVTPQPRAGDTYRVWADYVRATPDQLARDRAAIDPRARAYTRLGLPSGSRTGLELLGALFGALGQKLASLEGPAPDPRVVALARRLAVGASTEWELVGRVERYLLDGRRFRYTTAVPDPGPQPLVDFLLRDRAGYCQHFAGAAALLLRLAGVPARVVSGFATGIQVARGRYTVRDVDAHDWIEVYFEGYGWVPFNPTPAAARATIASGLDPLTPPRRRRRRAAGDRRQIAAAGATLAALAAALAAGVVAARRRGRRRPDHLQELLERTARRTGASLSPANTLSELAASLARVGPRTAALAAEIERRRFAAAAPAPARHPRMRLARALTGDLGPVRGLLLCAPGLLAARGFRRRVLNINDQFRK